MSWLTWLMRHLSWLVPITVLLVLVVLLPAFQRPAYWLDLTRQYATPALLALALAPIILTGGIDLSVGSTTVLVSVVIGVLWRDAGVPIGWAMALGVLMGLLAGLGNGVLVTVGVLPLVATLATRELYRGLAWVLSGDNPVSGFPPELLRFWYRPVLGLPVSLWAILALFAITFFVVHHTWPGRALYALGDNERAARFAGVPVKSLKLVLYSWSGLVAGLCGVGLVLRFGAAKVEAGQLLELQAIACVVVGGVRVTGGAGHMASVLLGTATVCALLAGLGRVPAVWRETLLGGILIVVALVNEVSARWAGLLTPGRASEGARQ